MLYGPDTNLRRDGRTDRQTDTFTGGGDNVFSIYDYNMARPLHKNPYLGGFEICNRCIYFLAHNHYIFIFLITPYGHAINYLPLGERVMKLTSSCLLTLLTLHTKFNKDWPNSSWEDVNGRRPTHNDARQPIARGYPSDSGDIKMHFHYTTYMAMV